MVFINDFTEALHRSLLDPDQLKVDILTCRLCPQVKMLFTSHFVSPFIGPLFPFRYTTTIQILAPIPSFHFHQVVEGVKGTARRAERDEVWRVHTPVESNGPKHFQACIMGSWGTAVIKTWMGIKGRRLQSISYRSAALSLLIDWSPGAAAPLCKVHHIITLQQKK